MMFFKQTLSRLRVHRSLITKQLVRYSSRASNYEERFLKLLEKQKLRFESLQGLSSLSSDDLSFLRAFQNAQSYLYSLEESISEAKELQALMKDPDGDEELKSIAKEDFQKLPSKINSLIEKLSECIVPEDSYNLNDATIEVRAGAGGLEAGLFSQEVFEFYLAFMRSEGFDVEVTEYNALTVGMKSKFTSTTGIQSAIALVRGQGVFQAMKHECGVHRVQRVPVTGTKNDRLQTSTCSVAVVPLPDESDIVLNEKDIKFEYMRSSGAGGQSVNKTDSACRATHIPTGIVTECQEERTQITNRKIAIKKIKEKLFEKRFNEEMQKVTSSRKSQIGTMNRNEKIRTYNWTRNMITDHRLGVSKQVPNLATFFNGSEGFDILKDFRDQLESAARHEKLLLLFEKYGI